MISEAQRKLYWDSIEFQLGEYAKARIRALQSTGNMEFLNPKAWEARDKILSLFNSALDGKAIEVWSVD